VCVRVCVCVCVCCVCVRACVASAYACQLVRPHRNSVLQLDAEKKAQAEAAAKAEQEAAAKQLKDKQAAEMKKADDQAAAKQLKAQQDQAAAKQLQAKKEAEIKKAKDEAAAAAVAAAAAAAGSRVPKVSITCVCVCVCVCVLCVCVVCVYACFSCSNLIIRLCRKSSSREPESRRSTGRMSCKPKRRTASPSGRRYAVPAKCLFLFSALTLVFCRGNTRSVRIGSKGLNSQTLTDVPSCMRCGKFSAGKQSVSWIWGEKHAKRERGSGARAQWGL
jgi:hypothetical protein